MAGLVDKVKQKMEGGKGLEQGAKVPTYAGLKENDPTKGDISLSTLKGKNLIVAVPGAFSSACSTQVPGYIEMADKFSEKGIQGIYVISVNDAFAMKGWKEQLGAKGKENIHFIADDEGSFTKEAGMSFDATAFFGNHRSLRYAALIEDGVVQKVFVEEAPTEVKVSKADNVLGAL